MQLDQVTQQNAALVDEAAAASEAMDGQARDLLALMKFFKTGDDADNQAPVPSRAKVEKSRPTAAKTAARRPAKNTRSAAKGDDEDWQEF